MIPARKPRGAALRGLRYGREPSVDTLWVGYASGFNDEHVVEIRGEDGICRSHLDL